MPRRLKLLVRVTVESHWVRVWQFVLYLGLGSAGSSVFVRRPAVLEDVVGESLVIVFALFLTIGAAMGAFSIFRGIWWLERVGLLALGTGMAMLFVMVQAIHAAQFSGFLALAFIAIFIQRWTVIKAFQLAPRKE